MQVIRDLNDANIAPYCALTIGNFDGVHRGHQAMLTRLKQAAAKRSLPTCVLTFDPHPKAYFAHLMGQPELAPVPISSLDEKIDQLAGCGIDQVAVVRFDDLVAAMTPRDFVRGMLLQDLHANYVLVGDDFRFGNKREGDFRLLEEMAMLYDFQVEAMQSYLWRGIRVSSSEVRKAIISGDMAYATGLLGQRFYSRAASTSR